MSTVAELAKVEGDEAEAAEDDETTEEPTEFEDAEDVSPEPPAPTGLTDIEAEREFKKLEKLAQTYLTKAVAIADRLGMPYQVCPLDAFPGLAIPRSANEVTSDVEAAVLGMIGKSAPPEFKKAPDYERCPQCDGWGDVLTGAQKEISRTAMCNRCGGKGYMNVIAANVTQAVNGAPTYPGADQTFTPLPQGIPDAWGRPAGHVHWGIDPAQVGV